ncbi:hypothetical protein Glove_249g10 [Diversispora epigaea]|uniref:Smr domain-containing protein n=1 Tax=Diversispora epigaea TaxID=1348612 RepID=A0A397IDR5_9GLOM|nr:hypothetical protein Glove_249g10 [Diversispora epigaea]
MNSRNLTFTLKTDTALSIMEEDIKLLRKNLGDDLRIKSPRDGHPKDPINLIQIDFHGCDVELASSILQRFKDSEKSLQQVPCVRFITGHARKRVTDAKIRPLVLSFLRKNFKGISNIKIDDKAKGHIDLLITRSDKSNINSNSKKSLEEKTITTIRKQSSRARGNSEDLFDVEAPLLSDMMVLQRQDGPKYSIKQNHDLRPNKKKNNNNNNNSNNNNNTIKGPRILHIHPAAQDFP